MNLQARRTKGDQFSNTDSLEVILNTDNQNMQEVYHTIESISGPAVTHGGGAAAGEFLHYKSMETDADSDGIIDYSSAELRVMQESPGVSVIRVICSYILKSEAEVYISATSIENARADEAGVSPEFPDGIDGNFVKNPPETFDWRQLKTGEITLEWSEDPFV